MSDTTYVVTVLTRINGKQKKTVQKCETEKQAAETFKKECLVFTQDKTWEVDPDECTDTLFIGIKTFPDGNGRGVVTIDITEEVNLEYYVQKIERICGVDGGRRIVGQEPQHTKDIRKLLRVLYQRAHIEGYDQCYDEMY